MEFVQFVRDHSRRLAVWSVATLLTLFPAVFFTHSSDLVTFLRVANSLRNGGVLYHDIVDIKPPLVYDIVRVFSAVGGSSEIGIHLVDTIYLFFALFVSSYLLCLVTKNITIALLSTWFMAVTYVSNSFAVTVQSESLALLPFVLFTYVLLQERRERNFLQGIFIGALTAVLVGLKLTLGAVILVAVVNDISNGRQPLMQVAKKWMGVAMGLVVVSFVIWRTLFNPESVSGYVQLLSFMKSYASMPIINAEWIRFAWKSSVILLFDRYSLTLSLLAIVGFGSLISGNDSNRTLVRTLSILFFVLMFTIIVERKFFDYHFFRFVVPLSTLSAYGTLQMRKLLLQWWRQGREKILLVPAVLILLVWSPVARFTSIAIPAVTRALGSHSNYAQDQPRVSPNLYRREESMINDSIRKYSMPGDHASVAAMNASRLALILGEYGTSFAAGSQFAMADYAPLVWQQRYADEMRKARWLVVGTNDSVEFFNRPPTNSMSIVSEREPFRSAFAAFARRWQTEHFIVYERSSVVNSGAVR
jgi:hypothetical protein